MKAFVTLVTSDDFLPGAQVLAFTILEHHPSRQFPLIAMVTSNLQESTMHGLQAAGWELRRVEPIPKPVDQQPSHVQAWDQVGYTKLNLWGLTDFEQIVYIDADAMVVENLDELFYLDTDFAAAPDNFPPDRFNAGVLVVRPGSGMLERLKSQIHELPSYDGGDTGFLNACFPQWYSSAASDRLPFGYNALRTMHALTKKAPGYWKAISPLKIIHFCSSPKPWQSAPTGDLERQWWVAYSKARLVAAR